MLKRGLTVVLATMLVGCQTSMPELGKVSSYRRESQTCEQLYNRKMDLKDLQVKLETGTKINPAEYVALGLALPLAVQLDLKSRHPGMITGGVLGTAAARSKDTAPERKVKEIEYHIQEINEMLAEKGCSR